MKKINKSDLETLKGIKRAWKEIDSGKGKVLSAEEFLKEVKKW